MKKYAKIVIKKLPGQRIKIKIKNSTSIEAMELLCNVLTARAHESKKAGVSNEEIAQAMAEGMKLHLDALDELKGMEAKRSV